MFISEGQGKNKGERQNTNILLLDATFSVRLITTKSPCGSISRRLWRWTSPVKGKNNFILTERYCEKIAIMEGRPTPIRPHSNSKIQRDSIHIKKNISNVKYAHVNRRHDVGNASVCYCYTFLATAVNLRTWKQLSSECRCWEKRLSDCQSTYSAFTEEKHRRHEIFNAQPGRLTFQIHAQVNRLYLAQTIDKEAMSQAD